MATASPISPSSQHPFLQPFIGPPASPPGSIKPGSLNQIGTTYYTPPRAVSDHHVLVHSPGAGSPTQSGEIVSFAARPPSVVSASSVASTSVTALSARQRPPSAPPRSVKGALGEARKVGGIKRTPLVNMGPTPAMEVAAAAAENVAAARAVRESQRTSTLQLWDKEGSYNGSRGSRVSRAGIVGVDTPRKLVQIPRDPAAGEVCQFTTTFPAQLESRLTPAAFAFFVEAINLHLGQASSTSGALMDNVIAVATLGTSSCWRTGHFEKVSANTDRTDEKALRRAEAVIGSANAATFNPKGLNVRSPRTASLQFLEIEYY